MAQHTMIITAEGINPPSLTVKAQDQVLLENQTTARVVVWFSPDVKQSFPIEMGATHSLIVSPEAILKPYLFWVDPPPGPITIDQLSGEIDVVT